MVKITKQSQDAEYLLMEIMAHCAWFIARIRKVGNLPAADDIALHLIAAGRAARAIDEQRSADGLCIGDTVH